MEMRGLWIDEYGASYGPLTDGIEYRCSFAEILQLANPGFSDEFYQRYRNHPTRAEDSSQCVTDTTQAMNGER